MVGTNENEKKKNCLFTMAHHVFIIGIVLLSLNVLFCTLQFLIMRFVFGVTGISLGRMLLALIWRVPLATILACIGLLLLGMVVELMLYLVPAIETLTKYIAGPPPKELMLQKDKLKKELDGIFRSDIGWIVYSVSIICYVLMTFGCLSIFWFICIAFSTASVCIYTVFIYRHGGLKIYEFYWLRKLLVPYLSITCPVCITAIYGIFWMLYLDAKLLAPLRISVVPDIVKDIAKQDEVFVRFMDAIILIPSPWSIHYKIMIEGCVWCFASALLVIWVLPVIIKRHKAQLVLLSISIITALLSQHFDITRILYISNIHRFLSHIPFPVIALGIIILSSKLNDSLKSWIGHSVICNKCRNRMKDNDKFCVKCGQITVKSAVK